MESRETSLTPPGDTVGSPEELSGSVKNRLHNRVMATAYKYKLMSPEEDGHTGGRSSYGRQGWPCVNWVVLILLVLLIVTTSLLIWQVTTSKANTQACLSPQCVDVSAYILRKMNRTANPCEDFYSYACGGWQRSTFIPPEKAKFDTFAEVHKNNQAILKRLLDERSTMYKGKNSSAVTKLKAYYRTCMDVNKIEQDGTGPVLKVIEDVGSWSVSPNNSQAGVGESWDLVTALTKFHLLGEAPILSFGLSVDSKNNSRFLLTFSQAGLTLDSHEEYLNNSETFRTAFLKFAVGVGQLLGGDDSTQQKMEAIYDFEKQLAEIFMSKEELIDPKSRYNLMTVAEFQDLIGPQLEVKRFMSGILNKSISDTEIVRITTKDYFSKLGAVLERTPKQVIQDYLVWHMLQQIPGYLPQAFVDFAMELNQAELGVTAVAPRWQRCVAKAEGAMGFASAALYVEETFPPESKNQALSILSDVQAAFIANLETVKWMDDETRNRAREKAVAMQKVLGYPDWILDPSQLDEYYINVTVKEGAFLENYFAAARADLLRVWSKVGTKPNKNEWSMLPDEVNAFFSTTYNQVVVLAGLLQRPYFDQAYPLSFVYGSMGAISGHELTHGFDNLGRKYDKDGNMNDWWSPAAEAGFKKHSQCMVDQYSRFEIEGTHVNGRYTLAENIADNAGLKLGYLAYEKKRATAEPQQPLPGLDLTPEQLFFVGFGQVWCAHYTPEYAQHSILSDEHTYAKYRVLGSVANLASFAHAFSCPAGSPLNPDHKCPVW